MLTFISILLIFISIILIIVVLLQPGKGGGIAGGLGGLTGQFSSMFGTRRATDFLSKLTIGFAAAIMILSLLANLFFVGGDEDIRRPITEGSELPAVNPNPTAPPMIPPQQPPQQPGE